MADIYQNFGDFSITRSSEPPRPDLFWWQRTDEEEGGAILVVGFHRKLLSSCWKLIPSFCRPSRILVIDQWQIFGALDICCRFPLSFGGSSHFCCGKGFTLTDRAWLWSIRNALCSTVPYTLWLFCTYILLKMLNNTL